MFNKNITRVCSPVMDLTTSDVWRLYAFTDWEVSDIYEKMYQAGIAPENQRVGSLLNFAATKNISSVKTLEPNIYAKINARFQNVEFMSQFSKAGYYKIGKPKDIAWNGRNHIKAGVDEETNVKLSDLYEKILQIGDIEYIRNGNDFEFPRGEIKIIKSNKPIEDLIESGLFEQSENPRCIGEIDFEEFDNMIEDGKIPVDLRIMHTTWKDYCLYMLNTTAEPLRSNWREKMVTSILSWSQSTGSAPDSTIDSLEVLSDLPDRYTFDLIDDIWNKDSFKVSGRLPISGKHILSIDHYPMESLEKEALICIEDIIQNKRKDLVNGNSKLNELFDLWNKQDGKSITPLEAQKNFFGKEEKIEYPIVEPIPDKFSDKYWENALNGARVWFKESISTTGSFKRFCIAILKNDTSLKYCGFGQSSKERLARANAISNFATQQEEKEKAKKQAEALAKKVAKEREQELKEEQELNKNK